MQLRYITSFQRC